MIGGIRDGQMPETANVFVLDLGFIFPTMITAIVGLVRRRDWAWPLAMSMVILTAVMLGSLVVADGIATLSEVTADPLPLVIVFAALAAAAVAAAWTPLRRLSRWGHRLVPAGDEPPGERVEGVGEEQSRRVID